MNYNEKQTLINEFKSATKNNEFKPYKDEKYGTKYSGKLHYLHYVFYAMLNNKNTLTTTHDKDSEKYSFRLLQLKHLIDYKEIKSTTFSNSEEMYSTNQDKIFNMLKLIMPSLTIEQAKSIIKNNTQ